VYHDQPRPEGCRQLLLLVLPGAPVDRQNDGANARDCEQRDDLMGIVLETETHSVSMNDTQIEQASRGSVDQVGQLSVVDRPIAIDDRREIRLVISVSLDWLAYIH
jgi:hypothetical protein